MKHEITTVVELIYQSLPYPHQVSNLDFVSETGAVRFQWRGVGYRISQTLSCEEVGDGVLIGSDRAILLEALVTREAARRAIQ